MNNVAVIASIQTGEDIIRPQAVTGLTESEAIETRAAMRQVLTSRYPAGSVIDIQIVRM